jgi:trimeric autotransporter adhesin
MARNSVSRYESAPSRKRIGSKGRTCRDFGRLGVECLEDRELLAAFAVTNLNNSGAGSLRQALVENNLTAGANTIDFDVAGTIRVGPGSLPSITNPVIIDGSSAPTFPGTPVVAVNFGGTQGFTFNKGSDGSTLRSLSVVNAGGAGVTLNASNITIQGNDIGLLANGTTIAGNHGDGIQINATSHNDLIGQSDPVTSISYANTDGVSTQPVSGWQGIRNSSTSGQYLITGTSGSNGLLYEGPISGVGGTSYSVNYPNATTTSVYGPDIVDGDELRLVGSYRSGSGAVNGFLFQGTTADLSQAGDYETIAYPRAQYTYVHSTMGNFAVGNADGPEGNAPLGTGHAFLYDVAQSKFLPDIVYPGATFTTAYGIWYNGGASYTITGGYSVLRNSSPTIGAGYLVDYNAATGQFSNWTSFNYPNGAIGQNFVTHFEGISSDEKGVYTLSADSIQSGTTNPAQGSWVTVRRNTAGSFGAGVWVNLNYPGIDPSTALTSADSVAGNQVVGIVIDDSGTFSFQSTVNVGFQLSNVISANGGNGIGIYGASDNQVAMNFIGTDASGTLRRGNAQNGILVTNGASRNLIGGQATGGNDPTGDVFVRPPQGNLISGNGANGVLINNGATENLLSGNFVGTSASGNSALGNSLDGVAIVNASNNQLIGCTFQQNPFVFYNVLSGNGGNGLRITNSNNTTVQANFMGVGANNATIVANGGDGLLISGSSRNTQVGGVIPLGNVISGNNRNGIEVRDTASGFISFNTFAGIFAFGGAAPNRLDGMLITSVGGNNVIRTCIVSGNLGNGIELGGNAIGVQVTDTAVGTNTSIMTAIPNHGNGILISGNAHGNAIGGFQPSVEPQVTVSANLGYGIAIVGAAHNNFIFHTYVGTNYNATVALGNTIGGIYVGPGASSNVIGGAGSLLQDKILNNGGAGVTIQNSSRNSVLGDVIQNNAAGGIFLNGGWNNRMGAAGAGNVISGNGVDGVVIAGDVNGSTIQANVISNNAGSGVFLSRALGLGMGGKTPGTGNIVTGNLAYGLIAYGLNTGTVVRGNVIAYNVQGNVDLTQSRGIIYIPGV